MSRRQKRVSETIEVHKDEKGQVTEERKVTEFSSQTEPDFIKLYLEDIVKLSDMPKGTSNILHCLLKRMDYENMLSLTPPIRKRICEEAGCTIGTLRQRLKSFVKSKIMVSQGYSTYFVNPNLFAKGPWREVLQRRNKFKQLALKVTYSEKTGRTVTGFSVTAGEEEHS